MADQLLEKQQQLLRSLDRALENFKKIGKNNYTPAKIRNRINALKEVWTQIHDDHITLKSIIPADKQLSIDYFNNKKYEAAEGTYLNTSDYMADSLEEVEPFVNPNQTLLNSSTRTETSPFSLTHLPPIKFPPFDGKFEEWETFRDRFTSLIIDNKDLSF